MSDQNTNLPKTSGRAETSSSTWFSWLKPDFMSEFRGMTGACRMFGCKDPLCEKDCGRSAGVPPTQG